MFEKIANLLMKLHLPKELGIEMFENSFKKEEEFHN